MTMQTAAIIAEYNPLHKGHEYHLTQTRRQTGADYLIVVMSGDFVQRGAPAVFDKYLRTRMALVCGADVVLELPAVYATASAEFFASGAVSLLNGLNVIDTLSFGSECGNVPSLWRLAQELCTLEKQDCFQKELLRQKKLGFSYPVAMQKAVHACTGSSALCDIEPLPNNILGLEYCKALIRSKSKITPVTILRSGEGYHSRYASSCEDVLSFASASALRQILSGYGNDLSKALDDARLCSQLPAGVYELLHEAHGYRFVLSEKDFSTLLYYRLISEKETGFDGYDGCGADLSAKICRYLPQYRDLTGFCELLKSKDLTYTQISRSLMRILLGIRKEENHPFASQQPAPYARLLGFRKSASPLLNRIKQESSIPLISKMADAATLLTPDGNRCLELDVKAAQLYEAVSSALNGTPIKNEYQQSPIVWDSL